METTSLNPYCSGQWSRTELKKAVKAVFDVLILIVVDNGLVLTHHCMLIYLLVSVLILIVVDNGLVQRDGRVVIRPDSGLNPYCSGQWSRTKVGRCGRKFAIQS